MEKKYENLSTHCRVKNLSPITEDGCPKQVCHVLDQHVGQISRWRYRLYCWTKGGLRKTFHRAQPVFLVHQPASRAIPWKRSAQVVCQLHWDPTHPLPDYRLLTLTQQAWEQKAFPEKYNSTVKYAMKRINPLSTHSLHALQGSWATLVAKAG